VATRGKFRPLSKDYRPVSPRAISRRNATQTGATTLTQQSAPTARPSRTQPAVYTLPRDWDSLDQVLVPLVEKIDPLDASTQLLVVVPDVESTVALVAGAFARFGVQGIDILPATSAARSARLLRTDPARAVAGPPWVLRQLLNATALRLEHVRAVLFAWIDDVIEEGGETLSDLETVLSEVPKGALKTLVVRGVSPATERFIERHLHHARRIGAVGSAVESRLPVSYVTTPRNARPAALRRVLDEVDPPSAMVLTRDDRAEEEARATLHQLGYRRADDVVRVSRTDVPANTHTVIFYEPPLNAAPLDLVAESRPARVVVLVEPRELESVRRLTGGRATPLERSEPVRRIRRSDELLQRDIRELLGAGFGGREISAIEPLLTEYDAVEVAGALVRMVERERERHTRALATAAKGGGDRREAPQRREDRRGQLRERPGGRPGDRRESTGSGGRPAPRRSDARPAGGGRGERSRGDNETRRGPRR
jgi:ATP-dependent RNA helicase DeaD